MVRVACKYHPRVPARWHCPACGVNVCPDCVKKTETGDRRLLCTACQGELDSLGIGNTITPFWERIPRFFAYPFNADCLVYLAMLAVASLAAFLPLAGIIISLLISFALLKYGYAVLSHTASGNLSPPKLWSANLAGENNLPLRQLVVFVLMGVVVGLAGELSPVAALVALFFMLFSVPASVMSMALLGSIVEALNPVALGRIMGRIGWPYLILFVFLLLLSGGSNVAAELLEQVLPDWLLTIAGVFITGYFTVIMFHMMGYVVYQYHEPLGYENVREFDRTGDVPGSRAEVPVDPFLNEVNILVSEGKLEEAKARLKARLRLAGTPDDRERYHRLLKLSGDKAELVHHGATYLRTLVELGRNGQALDVFSDCLGADPEFQVSEGRLAYGLGSLAHDQGRHDLALRILNRFAQRYPRHRDIPRAYLVAAKILCEHKNQDAQAKKILADLLRTYPDHESLEDIKGYLRFLDRLKTAPGAG